MKIQLFIIFGLLLGLVFGGGKIACAQEKAASSTVASASSTSEVATSTTENAPVAIASATSTVASATTSVKTTPTSLEVINSAYSLPEWHQNGQETFIWRGAYEIIRQGVSQLAIEPLQNLPIPVLFGITPAKLVQNFGDPRGTGRRHEGLDIVAPKGAPVVSPTPAVVLSASSGANSGYYVTTANPGGETFVYMHLDQQAQLTAGKVLQAGDLIGYVGNTGNAAGGGAHLHFEIRKNGATNPYPRLKTEFSPAQKISFLGNILTACSDQNTLAKFLVGTYPTEFSAAKAANLALPAAIAAFLEPAAPQTASGAPASGLGFGARDTPVVNLQNFLIVQNKGPAAISLSRTGATGYFGLLTRDALAEYNAAAKITVTAPASTTETAKLTVAQIKTRIAQIQTLILTLQKQLLEMQAQTA